MGRFENVCVLIPSPTLFVSLSADPPSGTAPLNGVDLTAVVSGTAAGDIRYRFDCNSDYIYERDVTRRTESFTAVDLCDYSSVRTHLANVEVTRGGTLTYGTVEIPVSPVVNQAPVAVATVSKDGSSYSDSITVTQGVATSIYLSANHSNSGVINNGSSDPNGWTDATNGVQPSPGKCEWNRDLNQGAPTFELPVIDIPASPSACNISLGNLTFNDSPGTYTYQVLRITDKPGLQSNVDTISVTVQAASEITCSRCSTNNKYAWAQWTSGPDGVCDTADECYVINPACLIYTCDCSCTAGSDTTWDPSCVSSCTGAPPTAPSNLSASAASCSQINLSWTDNSNNETGFKIERKTGAGGSWSQIATVGANVTTYPSTGLSENTTYYYRVRAYNADGDSDYSNEPYATTPLCVVPPGNQAPIAVATISKDGSTYADSIIVTKGVAFPIYLSASGSSDPNGWTDATNGVQPSPGKCEWNSDLNQGAPTYETTINIPDSAASCNISLGSKTFNDAPGTYTYQVLRITDKPGLQSNVDTVSVTVQEAVASTLSVTLSAPSPVAPSQNTTLTAYVSGTAPGPYNYAFWKNCDNPCVTVPTCRTACGNEDQLFTNVSATSKGYDTSYSVLGNHTATVIVSDPVASVSDEATPIVVISNPDFSLSASPSYNRIDRNDQTGKSYTITVNSISGFSSLVNLSVSGLPSGSTAAFVPSSLTPPADGSADSILTIKTNNTPIGSYTITVIGTAGPKTRQTTITLNVAITPWWREVIPW